MIIIFIFFFPLEMVDLKNINSDKELLRTQHK